LIEQYTSKRKKHLHKAIKVLLCLIFVFFQVSYVFTQEDFDNSFSRIEELLEQSNSTNNAADALKSARQALIIAQSTNNKNQLLRTHQSVAKSSLKLNEIDTAVVHYLEAAKLADRIRNGQQTKADIFTAIGNIFMQTEMYANAIPYFDSVLVLQPNNNVIREKKGDAYLLDSKINLAEQVYTPLISKFQVEGNLVRVVDIYQKLADASNRLRDPQRGIIFYQLIQDIVERIGSPAEKARLYNNIGYQYFLAHDYTAAINALLKAKLQCQFTKCDHPELHLINLGIVLHNSGDTKTGVLNLLEARDVLSVRKDKKGLANLEHLIAKTYFGSNDFYNALIHNDLAIKYAKETKNDDIRRNASKTAAELYLELYDHENAINYYRIYLKLDDSLRLASQDQQRALLNRQSLLERTEKNTQLELREKTIQELYYDRIQREQENLKLANTQLFLVARQKQDSLNFLQSQQLISEGESRRCTLELLQTNQQLKFEAQKREAEQEVAALKAKDELDFLKQQQKDSASARDIREFQKNAAISEKEKEQAQKDKKQQETFQKLAYGLGALGGVILTLLGIGWFFARRTGRRLRTQNHRIETQKALIEQERQKSDVLLRNILPDEIAAELKIAGEATPRKYEKVTVIFTDFVSFTKVSQNLQPEQLISELNECFLAFDEICENHNLEKIKTIGDAYMCAGGVPLPNDTNPEDAVAAALEMRDWLVNRNKTNSNALFRSMRIGVHTGEVIAGVVGKNKFAYDIWGDAVNLAARLEEFGEPEKVNISKYTYALVKDKFDCEYQGQKEVHNKGLVDMYHVIKPLK
jgi:adenylate cyclase